MKNREISLSFFGKGGPEVTAIGLGGEGVLRTFGREAEAEQVILEAILQGITYFDSARLYAGSEGYYGTIWSRHPEIRNKIFQTSKSASRDKKGARTDLEKTLATLKIDHLDLWQIHDLRSDDDFDLIAGPGGAWKPFWMPRKQGRPDSSGYGSSRSGSSGKSNSRMAGRFGPDPG